ncbi:MAG: hypothetical protein GW911_31310 [Armatimonadetes bacterium]|nr:hypothetical protein [Armatimonadota bacterium]NCO95614.1 hypothetical protein [Armatimonadota bacterium]NCP32973.1 hypothetical protein [Armatimonadota bacterium]NDK16541.1 hypothetical protein [Armatimonadota bacterium]
MGTPPAAALVLPRPEVRQRGSIVQQEGRIVNAGGDAMGRIDPQRESVFAHSVGMP